MTTDNQDILLILNVLASLGACCLIIGVCHALSGAARWTFRKIRQTWRAHQRVRAIDRASRIKPQPARLWAVYEASQQRRPAHWLN